MARLRGTVKRSLAVNCRAGDSPILSGILMRSLDVRQCISDYDIFSIDT